MVRPEEQNLILTEEFKDSAGTSWISTPELVQGQVYPRFTAARFGDHLMVAEFKGVYTEFRYTEAKSGDTKVRISLLNVSSILKLGSEEIDDIDKIATLMKYFNSPLSFFLRMRYPSLNFNARIGPSNFDNPLNGPPADKLEAQLINRYNRQVNKVLLRRLCDAVLKPYLPAPYRS